MAVPPHNQNMVRKLDNGNFIFSASEVASYVVCPLSWKLQNIDNLSSSDQERSKEGANLHREWDEKIKRSRTLSGGIRIVLLLLAIAFLIFGLHLQNGAR